MNEYTTSALDQHLAQHEKLVHWVVHRQWLGRLPYLEAVQAGRIGLWHALQHWWVTCHEVFHCVGCRVYS
jgi:hypothetical protein